MTDTFTFKGLFIPQFKGIPDTSKLPPYITITFNSFLSSLLLETLILTVLIAQLIVAIIRKARSKGLLELESRLNLEKMANSSGSDKRPGSGDVSPSHVEKSMVDEKNNAEDDRPKPNLVIKFDEEPESEESQEGENQYNQEPNQSAVVQTPTIISHDSVKSAITMQTKLNFLIPFLFPYVICINAYLSSYVLAASLTLSLILFLFFNFLEWCNRIRLIQCAFILPILAPVIIGGIQIYSGKGNSGGVVLG